jgi:hypothetical protein
MAIPLLIPIATGISTAVGFLAKHPIVAKMLFFSVFLAILSAFVLYIKSLVLPYIISNSLFALADYFGVLDGISLYISIVLAGFGAKQILAYIRS